MAEIQDNMFVFENLGGSDDRSLQTLLRSVDQVVLVVAMKGADAQLQEKLLGCMSTRAAANIRDEMEALGPVQRPRCKKLKSKSLMLLENSLMMVQLFSLAVVERRWSNARRFDYS